MSEDKANDYFSDGLSEAVQRAREGAGLQA
jgi:hypothetical protein